MKYILLLLLLTGCGGGWKAEHEKEITDHGIIIGAHNDEFYVVTVDDCEYIVFNGNGKGGIIHKANCKNH